MAKFHINRDDVFAYFLKGVNASGKSANNKWSVADNKLFYGDQEIAYRNPITFVVTKTSLLFLESKYSGSTLAAMTRALNALELFDLINPQGVKLLTNLSWIDAVKAKKALKTQGLTVVPVV